jgi:molecular chaperone DnaK
VRDAMKGEDVPQIKQATERLSQAAMRLAEAVQQGAASASPEGSSPGTQSEPDVVDAEFEEVDKRDRKAG